MSFHSAALACGVAIFCLYCMLNKLVQVSIISPAFDIIFYQLKGSMRSNAVSVNVCLLLEYFKTV